MIITDFLRIFITVDVLRVLAQLLVGKAGDGLAGRGVVLLGELAARRGLAARPRGQRRGRIRMVWSCRRLAVRIFISLILFKNKA